MPLTDVMAEWTSEFFHCLIIHIAFSSLASYLHSVSLLMSLHFLCYFCSYCLSAMPVVFNNLLEYSAYLEVTWFVIQTKAKHF